MLPFNFHYQYLLPHILNSRSQDHWQNMVNHAMVYHVLSMIWPCFDHGKPWTLYCHKVDHGRPWSDRIDLTKDMFKHGSVVVKHVLRLTNQLTSHGITWLNIFFTLQFPLNCPNKLLNACLITTSKTVTFFYCYC